MFDLDGIAPKIRALFTIFENWTQSAADQALNRINTYLNASVSSISTGGKRRAVLLTGSGNWSHSNVKDNFILVTLVAAGGAGERDSGSGDGGGGGGGGEVILRMPYFVTGGSTAYNVGGQTAGRSTDGPGSNGANTTFGSLTAYGGEGGGQDGSNGGGDGGGLGSIGGGAPGGAGGSTPIDGQDALFNAMNLEFRKAGGGGGGGADDGGADAGNGGTSAFSPGGAGSSNSGGGGASWGAGGPGVTGGGSGANGVEGGGGGGCNTGTSGAGGAGFILIEYEEAT